MRTVQSKCEDEKIEIGLVDLQSVRDAYIKAMVKSWTMSGTTGRVHYVTYQYVWLVGTQIASDSRLIDSVRIHLHL